MEFLTSDNIAALKEVLVSMTNSFGKTCKIYYHPILVDCDSCTDTIGNKTTNTWSGGGPVPLPCDMCNGSGKKPQFVTENIKIVIDWSPKEYSRNISNINLDFAVIKCRIMLYDLPKVLAANEIEVDLPSGNYQKGFYRLMSNTPDTGGILSQSYSFLFLKRVR